MRRVATLIAIVTVLAVAAMWWRTRRQSEAVLCVLPSGSVQIVAVHRGSLAVWVSAVKVRPPGPGDIMYTTLSPDFFEEAATMLRRSSPPTIDVAGVRVVIGDAAIPYLTAAGQRVLVVLPPWLLCAVAALVVAAPAVRARRRKPGTCPSCGYDLRASPDRCPECGAAIDPVRSA